VPETSEWNAGASANRPRSYFEELDLAGQLPREERYVETRVYGDADSAADLTGGGSVSMQHGGWAVMFGSRLAGEQLAAIEVDTEAFFYNLSGANGVVPGENEPFNDLYRTSISGVVRTPDSDEFGWFSGFELSLGGEDEAPTNESLSIGGLGGLRYSSAKSLDVELGIAAQSRLEDDPWFWPFLGLRWRASDSVSFEARGTAVEGRVALDRAWSVFARAEYELRQFRLNPDGPLAKGVFRDEVIRGGLGLSRRSKDGFGLELLAGMDLWREFNTFDRDGKQVSEIEADSAPFVALELSLAL